MCARGCVCLFQSLDCLPVCCRGTSVEKWEKAVLSVLVLEELSGSHCHFLFLVALSPPGSSVHFLGACIVKLAGGVFPCVFLIFERVGNEQPLIKPRQNHSSR